MHVYYTNIINGVGICCVAAMQALDSEYQPYQPMLGQVLFIPYYLPSLGQQQRNI